MQPNKEFPEESEWFGSGGTVKGEEGARPATSRVKHSQFGAWCGRAVLPLPSSCACEDGQTLVPGSSNPHHTPQDVFLGNAREGTTLGAEKEKGLDGENLLRAKVKAITQLWMLLSCSSFLPSSRSPARPCSTPCTNGDILPGFCFALRSVSRLKPFQ